MSFCLKQYRSSKTSRRPAWARQTYLYELTVPETSTRGRSLVSIFLSIIVLLLISSMIVAAIVIINPDIANFSKRNTPREAITLEEALLGELAPQSFDYNWLAASVGGDKGQAKGDQILYEESKNIKLIVLPNVEEKNAANADASSIDAFKPIISTLVSNSSLLASIKYQGYKLSPSGRYLLIWTSKRKQFRHSSTARYFIYDIKLDLISLLSTEPAPMLTNQFEQLDSINSYLTSDQMFIQSNQQQQQRMSSYDNQAARFQLADWFATSNDNQQQQADSLILVQDNDLFVLNNISQLQDSDNASSGRLVPIRLTNTGKPDEIFNGVPDWLYEEEILTSSPAYQVSPNGQRLAYMSFNDSLVGQQPYTIFGEQITPTIRRIRYPKAGQPNPLVSVNIIEPLGTLNSASSSSSNDDQLDSSGKRSGLSVRLPDELTKRQHYIYRLTWLSNDKLALIWTNRAQNESFVLVCTAQQAWQCYESLHLEAPTGWLDTSDDLFALDDDHYLALVPKFETDQVGTFKHLAKVSLKQPNQLIYLTSGRKEVLEINAVDAKHSLVYYTSTVVGQPGQRQVFVVSLQQQQIASDAEQVDHDGANKLTTTTTTTTTQHPTNESLPSSRTFFKQQQQQTTFESVCLTCDHYPLECLYNFAKFSPSTSYYMFHCDGPDVPRTELRSTLKLTNSMMTAQVGIEPTSGQAKQDEVAAAAAAMKPSVVGFPVEQYSKQGNASLLASERRRSSSEAPTKRVDATNLLWIIEDNRELREKLRFSKAMPLTFRLKVPIANSSYEADVLLLLPPHLGPNEQFQRSGLASGGGQGSLGAASLASAFGSHTRGDRRRRASSSSSPTSTNKQQQQQQQQTVSVSKQMEELNGALDDKQIHLHYTLESIQDYVNQLQVGQQFPMVVDVYGGPGSQKVDFRHHVYYGHYLASSRRTIYAMIDGRGSGFQGSKRLHELYHKFGSVEIQDQIDTVQQLTNRFNFINANKVAIWGWSYGGYAAAMALAQSNKRSMDSLREFALQSSKNKNHQSSANANPNYNGGPKSSNGGGGGVASIGSLALALRNELRAQQATGTGGQNSMQPLASLRGVFECAASVAPVTNWLLYDTAYTERYMGSPYRNELFDESRLGDHSPWMSLVRPSSLTNRASINITNEQNKPTNRWSTLNNSNNNNENISPNSTQLLRSTTGLIASDLISSEQQQHNKTTKQVSEQQMASNSLNNLSGGQKMSSNRNLNTDLNDRYKQSSLLEQIANIDRKRFLLIHGTADDNVHFQQSIMLMKRLISKNILFQTRLYPDQDHGIANKADKLHLGTTLSNFFAECFDMPY